MFVLKSLLVLVVNSGLHLTIFVIIAPLVPTANRDPVRVSEMLFVMLAIPDLFLFRAIANLFPLVQVVNIMTIREIFV